MNKLRAAVIGATGMVGQRFITLLSGHPWFQISVLAASPNSAGLQYKDAVAGRWAMDREMPEEVREMTVLNAADIKAVAKEADLVFSAVSLSKEETRALEEAYAKAELPVISNNSACRGLDDVPMLIPEINADHLKVIEAQKKRLGTRRGFIAVKPNCSIQSYVPALTPLMSFGLEEVMVCTYQAVSGAGRTLESWPEMADNIIPYIGGEEEKSEKEPLKIWGQLSDSMDSVIPAAKPVISAQCLRVPASNGHMAAVSVKLHEKPSREEIISRWKAFESLPQTLGLPSAPKPFIRYFEENDRPQTKLDRMEGQGMGICVGRLREDPLMSYRFVCLSHNTLRGAAGGAVLMAELLYKLHYLD